MKSFKIYKYQIRIYKIIIYDKNNYEIIRILLNMYVSIIVRKYISYNNLTIIIYVIAAKLIKFQYI